MDSGIYFAPLPRDECLYSNLFRVAFYPSQLHTANTDLRYPGQIWSRAKELGVRIGGEWYLKGKQLCSFHDLRLPPWNHFCDCSRVETDPSDAWAHSPDREQRNDFVHLLTRCLMEKLWPLHIGFLPDLGLFYFRATPTLKPRNLSYPSLKRTAAKTVFAPYASKTTEGRTAYYRHSAFEGFFRRLDEAWYLELTPTYYFSSDGRHISRFAAERLAGIKRLERNAAVLGQLRMWTACLTEPASLYDQEYPFLKFDKPEFFAFEYGIDDEAWLKREYDDVAKTIKTDLDQARLFD